MIPGSLMSNIVCDITAIVTAYRRIDRTLATLQVIRACKPSPKQILVRVDANQTECEEAIRGAFPDIGLFCSARPVGPGGGRNKLLSEAKGDFVASFDDDS